MTYESIMEKLNAYKKFSVAEEKVTGNSIQIKLNNGAIINCFNNGNHNVQGKNIQEVKNFLDGCGNVSNKKVFVVYGHDEIARTQLEALLRRWDLDPIILDQQASAGQTIIEKLEEYGADVGYAIILATPDDEGKAKTESNYKARVRQNVVLELGMFLAKLGREKVAILLKEDSNFEKPSDIQGLIYIPFQNKVDEVSISLIRELSRQGFSIDSTKI
ncbi:MAG: nucleotide-binding protein [Clostridia bacterium]|nr:nucleotide-binding protein [Clostridia bacterium]